MARRRPSRILAGGGGVCSRDPQGPDASTGKNGPAEPVDEVTDPVSCERLKACPVAFCHRRFVGRDRGQDGILGQANLGAERTPTISQSIRATKVWIQLSGVRNPDYGKRAFRRLLGSGTGVPVGGFIVGVGTDVPLQSDSGHLGRSFGPPRGQGGKTRLCVDWLESDLQRMRYRHFRTAALCGRPGGFEFGCKAFRRLAPEEGAGRSREASTIGRRLRVR